MPCARPMQFDVEIDISWVIQCNTILNILLFIITFDLLGGREEHLMVPSSELKHKCQAKMIWASIFLCGYDKI